MYKSGVLFFALSFPTCLLADNTTSQTCRVSFSPQPQNQNIFSPQQEVDLGDAIAESALLDLHILSENDPVLDRIAKRLAATAPLPGLRIRTFLVEVPQANALVTPGGRVYVSRALIRLTQNEDELAGIMAHEFGHLLAHQYAIRVSRLMKSTMGVTSVGDRRDIFDKYHRMMETLWTKPQAVSIYDLTHPDRLAESDEYEADRLGLDIQAAAGYDPMAPIRAFDRLAETKGNTGNFFANLLNFAPDRKRLGLMLKSIPAGCTVAAAHGSPEFLQWRERVLVDTSAHYPESLAAVLTRRTLSPLADRLRQLRFTSDGQYVITQDRSGINVLSAQPLAVLFRVPAENAGRAELTPDGRDLVFIRSGTHVERWNLVSHTRTQIAEIPLRQPCIAEKLSPDGRFLVCVDQEWTLRLIEVSSGEPVVERKNFGADWVGETFETTRDLLPKYLKTINLGTLEASMLDFPRDNQSFVQASRLVTAMELSLDRNLLEKAAIDFSPDARFFLAAPEQYPGSVLAWDLNKKAAVHVGGALRKLNGYPSYHFVFVANNRVLMSPKVHDVKSSSMVAARLVEFPSGKVIAKMIVPAGRLTRASDGGFAIIHPSPPNLNLTAPGFQPPMSSSGAYRVELDTGDVVQTNSPALDILHDLFVSDNAAGEVELRARKDNKLLASLQLPRAELASLRAEALSDDMSRLLISSQTHAAIWNVTDGAALLRFGPVNAGTFDTSRHLLLDVPDSDTQKRRMVDLDLDSRELHSGSDITAPLADQKGKFVVVIRTRDGSRPVFALDTFTYQNIILDVLDARTMSENWSRKFPNEAPLFFFDPSGRYGLFIWSGHSERVQRDPELRTRLSELERNLDKVPPVCRFDDRPPAPAWFHERVPHPTYLLKFAETIDMASGQTIGRVLFDPGDPCMRIVNALPLGHAIAIADAQNRILTYDADSVEPRARVFGHLLAGDPVRARIAVGKEPGRVIMYDALTGDQKEELKFPAPPAILHFRIDGLALFAVTTQQEAITVRLQ